MDETAGGQGSDKSVDVLKNEIRKTVRSKRDAFSKAQREEANSKMAFADLSSLHFDSDMIVAGYYPIRSECDCLGLLERVSKMGARTALPVIQGDGQGLLFRAWTPGDLLEKGQMAIPEPVEGASIVEPDVLFIPLLAFDKRGYRIGYGKGHYDRTIASLTQRKSVTAIGVAFDFQEVELSPCDPYDQPLDWVVTPSGLRKLGE